MSDVVQRAGGRGRARLPICEKCKWPAERYRQVVNLDFGRGGGWSPGNRDPPVHLAFAP